MRKETCSLAFGRDGFGAGISTGFVVAALNIASAACRGPNLFRCGPLYTSYDYLGTDPDPFIRTMIQRDLGAKYGPAE